MTSSWFHEVLAGAITPGLNLPTFRLFNAVLVSLVALCVALLLSVGDAELRLHFSVMAALALLLGASLNFVVGEARLLKGGKVKE